MNKRQKKRLREYISVYANPYHQRRRCAKCKACSVDGFDVWYMPDTLLCMYCKYYCSYAKSKYGKTGIK